MFRFSAAVMPGTDSARAEDARGFLVGDLFVDGFFGGIKGMSLALPKLSGVLCADWRLVYGYRRGHFLPYWLKDLLW
jgi:hypothetical protein